ncbi:hypothetical protein V8C86DRAFT_2842962 [Haematococcus lacustris]
MNRVQDANAAHSLQKRATTIIIEARVASGSSVNYIASVLKARTHLGVTRPVTGQQAPRGWGLRIPGVSTILQPLPPPTVATQGATAPRPTGGPAAGRTQGGRGRGGEEHRLPPTQPFRGSGGRGLPPPSSTAAGGGSRGGSSRNSSRNSSRGSSDNNLTAFDELAIEAGFPIFDQAHTEGTGGDAGATIENNATRVDPLPHPAGDNDPSGGANATQEGAAQRDLGGPSGAQRAGTRTQTHSPALTPGAERAARRQRQGGSGAGRGLNLSFTSKMDSISAEDHNPGGSPMEEEQAEKTTEDTMTAEAGLST